MNQDLKKAIQLIDSGNFIAWQGLTSAWDKDDLNKIEPDLKCSGYNLAERKATKCLYPLTGQPQPLQFFLNEKEQIFLLRLEDVQISGSLNDLLVELGTPDAILTLTDGYKYAPARQYIFSRRGIALYILGDPKKGSATIMAVALFKPSSLENYKQNLGGMETVEYSKDSF